jgi:membrane protease YdiL (CAAX protease family)
MIAAQAGLRRSASWAAAAQVALPAFGLIALALLRGVLNEQSTAQGFASGAAFGVALLGIGLVAGSRPGRPRVGALLTGAGGGLMLIAVPVLLHARPLGIGVRPEPMLLWVAITILVASSEEVLLRGVLLEGLERLIGPVSAVAVTSLLFGLMHVPLYGWTVVPVDVAAGVWLAGLRRLSGGVAAPIVAHVLADLATRWL